MRGEDHYDTLVIGGWDQTLSWYKFDGKALRQSAQDKRLKADPLCLTFHSTGKHMTLSDSNGHVTLLTTDGIEIGTICTHEDWVWTAAQKPGEDIVAVGTNNGYIETYHIAHDVVNGLHKEIYAYRENITDIVVHNMSTDKKLKIRCDDVVQKVAVFRTSVVVQARDVICLYDEREENDITSYYLVTQFNKRFDYNILLLTSKNILTCQVCSQSNYIYYIVGFKNYHVRLARRI